jgi:hypothetical protein
MATKPMSCGPDRGSVQKLVGFGGHRYDRSGDVDLGVVNALGIAIDRDGPMPHAALARLCRVPNYSEWMLVSVETVQNLGCSRRAPERAAGPPLGDSVIPPKRPVGGRGPNLQHQMSAWW